MIRKPHSLNDWRSPISYQQRVPAKSTECQTFLKAASLKRLRLLRMMVDGGIDVNVRDVNKGHTALINVILSDVESSSQTSTIDSIMEYLLRKGADPNVGDYNGKTALIHACQQEVDISVVRMLVMYHADPNIKDLSGKHAACYVHNNPSLMALLAPAGSLQSCRPKTLVRQDTLPFDLRDMYNYLTVPDNAIMNPSPFLDIPNNRETKWSPKVNRKKPFYRVEELEAECEDSEDLEGVILKCPELRTESKTKLSANSVPPKVQISNENGETRLLVGLPNRQLEVHRMKNSLFEWERQMSMDDLHSQKRVKPACLRKQKTEGGFTGAFMTGEVTKGCKTVEESCSVIERETEEDVDMEEQRESDNKGKRTSIGAEEDVQEPDSQQVSRRNMQRLRRWTVDTFSEA